MEKFEEEEIEENIYFEKPNITKEFYKQMFKKLNPDINMIHMLNLKIGNDLLNLFEDLAEKNYLNELEDNPENNIFFRKGVNNNLNKKIKELNKGCEKLIEEQKKYINFYKSKKYLHLTPLILHFLTKIRSNLLNINYLVKTSYTFFLVMCCKCLIFVS